MIRIEREAEPPNFDADVRQPGMAFIAKHPNPSSRQWNRNSYWRKILTDLRDSYKGICAYSCHWVPADTGGKTVEHFVPKTLAPELAFEWSNYRLVCAILNSRKGTKMDVLDPFEIDNGWFVLSFPSCLVAPAHALEADVRHSVETTICRLGLNDESTCVRSRFEWLKWYCTEEATLQFLGQSAPFIAMELVRQGLVEDIKRIMIF